LVVEVEARRRRAGFFVADNQSSGEDVLYEYVKSHFIDSRSVYFEAVYDSGDVTAVDDLVEFCRDVYRGMGGQDVQLEMLRSEETEGGLERSFIIWPVDEPEEDQQLQNMGV
jgi:hypothetical protein